MLFLPEPIRNRVTVNSPRSYAGSWEGETAMEITNVETIQVRFETDEPGLGVELDDALIEEYRVD